MHDPSLHLFIDDCHVRNLFGLRRTYGSLEKLPEPVLEDIPGRLACWASVLQEPDGCFRMWYQSTTKESAHKMATAGVWGGNEFGFFPDRYPDAIGRRQSRWPSGLLLMKTTDSDTSTTEWSHSTTVIKISVSWSIP